MGSPKKPSNPLPISELINHAIDDLGIRDRIDETQAVDVWHELAGPYIAGVTEQVWVRQGKLFVELNSGSWRQELHMNRVKWRDRLNECMGKRVISEIIFQ
ncbi:MAG: DUF721 domain-containing protein [Bacteroidetes bacterium]|nr:DUF721 domain-containing protein [Bacteroidota bacterium]MCY4233160.1 DUF721 domain-containing protein [Bacteroidota bacterium]